MRSVPNFSTRGNACSNILTVGVTIAGRASAKFDLQGIFFFGTPKYLESGNGSNNDYLVWKGSVDIPEPATLGLVGARLIGVALDGGDGRSNRSSRTRSRTLVPSGR